MSVLSFTGRVITGESLCLCVSIFLPLKRRRGPPEDPSLKALQPQRASRQHEMPILRVTLSLYPFWSPVLFLRPRRCQWAKPIFYCFLSSTGCHIFYTWCALPWSGFPPVSVILLVCVRGTAEPSLQSTPHLSVALQYPVLCQSSISHWDSPAKGGLLEEHCWANGMTALVIWKLPALYASHYWQWYSRRIYDSSQALVNFSLLFRCQLYTNEVIEHALYAVASTLLTQRSRTGASLWWHCYRTNHTRMTNTRNFECFFFSHHGPPPGHFSNRYLQIQNFFKTRI